MTMTLEISPELQAQIERAATQSGIDAEVFVINATRRAVEEATPLPKGSRRTAIEAARGSLRGIVSSDEFLSERHAEAEREREKDEAMMRSEKNS